MQELLDLKNGTDVRGTAIAGDGDPVTLTDEAATRIAKAFCVWTERKLGKMPTVAIGHDSRLSSPRLARLTAEAVAATGGNAILTGLSSTPATFMLLKDGFGADASVMITASHLPYRKNGMKFFTQAGGLGGNDVSEVLEIAARGDFPTGRGNIREESYLERYAERMVSLVRKACGEETPLLGKRILVDAGNGAGGFYCDLVLKPLGADTAGSQFLDPDGRFPNHVPNPENAEAMKSVSDAVLKHRADFGIIFDTDVDRAGAVAPDGKEINRNRLIALISAILLEERAGAIVTDSVTSDHLAEFIADRGGTHVRFKRGYSNVINECKRLNEAGVYSPLAIETSGHAALKENYYLDDGAYLVTRLLISLARLSKQGKNLLDLISDLEEPAEAREIRLRFRAGCDCKTLGARVLEEVAEKAKRTAGLSLAPDGHEGVRINFDQSCGKGWAMLRMSLHEPILPVNAESDEKGGTDKILSRLYGFLKEYAFLDADALVQNG